MNVSKVIFNEGINFEILSEIKATQFLNSNGTVNRRVLGLYVHECGGNKVLQRDNNFLICKEIEDAIIIE
jgi:hypothetical protein|tara:strand:- start:235 stop:444 length:210 start_codon:yes stop_codon:yes gene_type:complete